MTTPIAHNPALIPPGPAGRAGPISAPAAAETPRSGPAFADVLRGQTGSLHFSGHALARVERRGIELSPERLARLEAGVDRLTAKGARESVVLIDDTAYVVSVQNRTVITAVPPERMRDQVFTNIDSAAIG